MTDQTQSSAPGDIAAVIDTLRAALFAADLPLGDWVAAGPTKPERKINCVVAVDDDSDDSGDDVCITPDGVDWPGAMEWIAACSPDRISMLLRHIDALTATPAPAQAVPACRHARYSLDVHEQVGTCLDCGAEGRMQFVVAPKTQAPVAEHAEPFAWIDPAAIEWLRDPIRGARASTATALSKNMTADQSAPVYTAPQPVAQPLSREQIKAMRQDTGMSPDDWPEPWAYERGVRDAERAHGIGSAGGEG